MWTEHEIEELRLLLGMNLNEFANALGVGLSVVQGWEMGYEPLPFHQTKLDNLKKNVPSYFSNKARLRKEIEEHEAAKAKSEYVTIVLPDGSSVSAKKRS